MAAEVRFADGFDGPDRVAFGLGPAPLLAVASSLIAGYALLTSPLPPIVSGPAAALVMAAGATAGWLRLGGRPAVEWAALAVRHLARARSGTLAVPWDPPSAAPWQTEGGRGTPEVWLETPHPRHVTFFSLSGGSGRTTLATELACLATARGRVRGSGESLRVILIDADPIHGDVATRVGVAQLTALDYAAPSRPQVSTPDGLTVLPGSPLPLAATAQDAECERLAAAVRHHRAAGAHLVVTDICNDLGPVARWVLTAADAIYVVVTPTARGIHDAYRSTAVLRRMRLRERLWYVVNRRRGEGGIEDVLRDLNGRLAAVVPHDDRFAAAEDQHAPLSVHGRGPVPAAIAQLAAHACGIRTAGAPTSPA